MKSWLQDNGVEMYSTHDEEKSIVARRFFRILKNKTYRDMTSISKMFIFINYIIYLVNTKNHVEQSKWNIDVQVRTCINFEVENNDKDPKFEVGNCVRISK